MQCRCGEDAVERTVTKDGANKGKLFFSCAKPRDDGSCGFFEWVENAGSAGGAGASNAAGPSRAGGRAVAGGSGARGNNVSSSTFTDAGHIAHSLSFGIQASMMDRYRENLMAVDEEPDVRRCKCKLEARMNTVTKVSKQSLLCVASFIRLLTLACLLPHRKAPTPADASSAAQRRAARHSAATLSGKTKLASPVSEEAVLHAAAAVAAELQARASSAAKKGIGPIRVPTKTLATALEEAGEAVGAGQANASNAARRGIGPRTVPSAAAARAASQAPAAAPHHDAQTRAAAQEARVASASSADRRDIGPAIAPATMQAPTSAHTEAVARRRRRPGLNAALRVGVGLTRGGRARLLLAMYFCLLQPLSLSIIHTCNSEHCVI